MGGGEEVQVLSECLACGVVGGSMVVFHLCQGGDERAEGGGSQEVNGVGCQASCCGL